MKRNKNKRLISIWLFALLVLIFVPVTVFAQNTTLTATVPSQFQLEIEINGKGKIWINEKYFSETTTISIDRYKETIITIIPAPDYEIESVLYNGKNMAGNLQSRTLTLPIPTGDAKLAVNFTEKAPLPQTGDSHYILVISIITIILSYFLFMWLIRKRKKI